MNPSMSQELADQRILITRPHHQAQDLATQLEDVGATPLLIPTVEVTSTEGPTYAEALGFIHGLSSGTYSATLLTSANAVAALTEALEKVGQGTSSINATTCFSVGPATSLKARESGVTTLITSEIFSGAGVLQTAQDHFGDTLASQRFLFPRALNGRDLLVNALRKAGARVDVAKLYRSVPITKGPKLPLPLHWLTFTSPSAVEGFFCAYSLPPRTQIGCIGPVTAKEVEKHDHSATVIAAEHSVKGLVKALVDFTRNS